MIPLVHDLSDETVLVVGGGRVGARRARTFAPEARVVVVSATFADAAFGGAERIRVSLEADDVEGWLERVDPALVVAATDDPTLNAAVEATARRVGVLVNRADSRGGRPAHSVIVPATARVGPVGVAVTSDGTYPVLSRAVRDRLESQFGGVEVVARILETIDTRLRVDGVDDERRRDLLRAVARSEELWDDVGDGAVDLDALLEAAAGSSA